MQREKYKTTNKELIYSYIIKQTKEFSSQDLYKEMKNNKEHIGLTTIYRYLDELVNNNILKKIYNENNIAYYQYLKECNEVNHFYLKCTSCGKLIHADCDCIEELQHHLNKEHNFNLDLNNLMIPGICEECKRSK